LDIKISNAGGVPIYEQIVSQVKAKIIAGELREGDALPSMRLLAKELRISVITTKRAYEELEREGFIVSMTGKGSFVAGRDLEFVREEQLRQIEEHMAAIAELAASCKLSFDELVEMLRLMFEGE
jgi:GntR family transcriptional regulator